MLADAVENLPAAPKPQPLGQDSVKTDVRRVEFLPVARCLRFLALAEVLRQGGLASRVESPSGLRGYLAFESATNEQAFAGVGNGNQRDEGPMLRLNAHEALERQP